jgi:hypothetical protein
MAGEMEGTGMTNGEETKSCEREEGKLVKAE